MKKHNTNNLHISSYHKSVKDKHPLIILLYRAINKLLRVVNYRKFTAK